MKTEIRPWGNSLAVRIPRPFAREIKLEQGSEVDLSLDSGHLVIKPLRKNKTRYALSDLLSRVSKANKHQAMEAGDAVGAEVW